MTKLEQILSGKKSFREEWLKNDIPKLKEEIKELRHLPDGIIEMIYSNWSQDHYCASWHVLTDTILIEFKKYLLDEIPE